MADIAGIRACTTEKQGCRKRKKLSALFAALLSGRIFASFGKIQICRKSCP